ncbi:DEAD/DEAH box helicase family protein [Knoellia sp. CPCC 206453]|uniref:DEAD/DEAH box helicase family protein n=1 Tax=Knoellia pratensis TaxID=3404796 RepID=UPI00361785AC
MATNFDFVPESWGETRGDAVRAEAYGSTDARSCVFYARRVVEQVVIRIYDLERLTVPYKSDLAARLGDSGFRAVVGPDIATRANLIRKTGNVAVHESRDITPQTALNVLRQLHDILKWAAYTYSTAPDDVPTSKDYDPSLIPSPADAGSQPPLSPTELTRLLAAFEAKDAALADAKASNASLQAELDEARAAVAAAQAAKTPKALTTDVSEAETRVQFIDQDLREAGWDLSQEREREYPVSGMPNAQGKGFVDYVLWGDDGLPLAIVEAKRTMREAMVGQQQAKLYADCLESMTGRRPVIMCTNGYDRWIWDDAAGYPPRKISGFLTKNELELMVQRRQTRLPLESAVIDKSIVERHYQARAIRSVGEAFEAKRREALLVMATGSGKTRTVIALVDQLMKQGWAKRVLFLADRVALVNQAVGAFKTHLPSASTVNLITEKDANGRVFVATYPTMMGLINDTDKNGGRQFGPGYFDLIVIDEAHRSVYAKYGAIFDWFDAMLVGLTATPKDEIDRNTYSLFHLEDGVPTDAYSLDEAVAEGYLVPPVGVSVPLRFMRTGIHYGELSDDEKEEWDSLEWGEDDVVPTDVNPEELNKWLFNEDTVDKALKHLMEHGHKVAGGDRLGKTIIFAKNNAHAEFIRERFDTAYPEFAGDFARVVTYKTEYAQSLIDDFSSKEKAPHIAISVDMLDTGIDVPEVVNLVFFKLVRSVSKFWQMIGRGTRLSPDLYGPGDDKKNFYVFDFCMNLEYFNQPGAGSEGSLQKSLGQRLFEARLGLLAALDADDSEGAVAELRKDTATHLHEIVAGMNLDNFIVRPEREWVQTYATWERWAVLSPQEAGEVAQHLAGLPSSVRDNDEDAKRFDLVMLKIQLARLDGDALTLDRLRRQVQQIASGLLDQTAIPAIAEQQGLLAEVSEDEWWVDVTLPMLELARRRIRGLVRLLEKTKRAIVYTNFEDEIGDSSVVVLPGVAVGTNWERFKAKARAFLLEHGDNVALEKVRRNRQLTETDLSALEELLASSGAGGPEDIARAREESQGLGLFIRGLVGLDREAASEAFSDFLADSTMTVTRIRFVELIVEQLTVNGIMEARRLYEAPFTDHAPTGPDFLFEDEDVDRMVLILDEVRAHAISVTSVA